MKIIVIGAGIGGLSTACLLAAKGHQVQVFEKNEAPGGKMNQVQEQGYRFDTGPSLLTMPFLLEQLFQECGFDMDEFLTLSPLDPLCRYFYQDDAIFNCYEDNQKTQDEIASLAPADKGSYLEFLNYARDLYDKTADAFIFNPLFQFRDLRKLNIWDFFGIDAFSTVSEKVDEAFESPYLRKFFKRFTTYNGSSPFQAPATLNVIPHVEMNQGGYYVQGGLYQIALSLEKMARELGVEFHYNQSVDRILTQDNRATGVSLSGEKVKADLVVSNSDATETIVELLSDDDVSSKRKRKARQIEPSCSGFVLLLGVDHTYDKLAHHNIFFSNDYEEEFNQIFRDKVMPDDPTIYLANTSYSDKDHAPKGHSNFFLLVNAPYLSEAYNWKDKCQEYRDKVIRELEKRGLEDLSKHIKFQKIITPEDFYRLYRSNKGSIYGTSSNNKFAAFLRPRNKSREVDGLYMTGGSTHPGGGIPLVVQSAFNTVQLIERFEMS